MVENIGVAHLILRKNEDFISVTNFSVSGVTRNTSLEIITSLRLDRTHVPNLHIIMRRADWDK
jgi:hypothetical protein